MQDLAPLQVALCRILSDIFAAYAQEWVSDEVGL